MITTAREEQFLAKYAGEDVPIPEPKTRTEMYLAKMAGMDVDPPAPITREEQILSAIAENGGGGGGGDSDFSFAKVTLSSTNVTSDNYEIIAVYDDIGLDIDTALITDGDKILDVPLYKGSLIVWCNEDIVVSGNASYDEDEGVVIIQGDCTLKGRVLY